MSCDPGELVAAARALMGLLRLSGEPMTARSIYRTPAASLRQEADAIEQRDAAIERMRKALEGCP